MLFFFRNYWQYNRPLAKLSSIWHTPYEVRQMKYEQLRNYSDAQFRRITGVKRLTFEKMLLILLMANVEKHKCRGRNPKLSMENRLLAALEYWREYRIFAHIAASYGVSESSIFKTIRWIEDVLIKDGTFSLPGKRLF